MDGDVMNRILFLFSAFLFTGSVFCHAASYSEAIKAGNFLYVSGQFPIDPTTGKIIDGDMETLTNQAIDNMQHLLHVKGYNMNQVVKTEVYLTDIRDYEAMDSAYKQRFPYAHPPARDVVQVAGLLYNSAIEISCIAYKD